jgi:hypothetical protein
MPLFTSDIIFLFSRVEPFERSSGFEGVKAW